MEKVSYDIKDFVYQEEPFAISIKDSIFKKHYIYINDSSSCFSNHWDALLSAKATKIPPVYHQ